MHKEKELAKKSFISKTIFFIVILVSVAAIYLDGYKTLDAIYFGIVLTLFIRYLTTKLYH